MNGLASTGLGTKLRILLAMLDGELSEFYADQGQDFRPRFYPVFQLLLRDGEASVGAIALCLRASQPAATQTLGEMKRLGLVDVQPGEDRRQRVVTLTDHGHAVAHLLEPTWRAVRGAAEQLDSELSSPLSGILDEAIAALEQRGFGLRIAEHHELETNA